MVLRREDYAWTPVLGVFDNFHEVGYFPALFTFSLKALYGRGCLWEAMRGHVN